jgi:hypothetical protein
MGGFFLTSRVMLVMLPHTFFYNGLCSLSFFRSHEGSVKNRDINAKTQRRKDAKTQRRRDAETQRRRDAETQRRRDAETQRRREKTYKKMISSNPNQKRIVKVFFAPSRLCVKKKIASYMQSPNSRVLVSIDKEGLGWLTFVPSWLRNWSICP